MTHKILNVLFTLALVLSFGLMTAAQTQEVHAATTITFTGEELLGKPTDSSITINIVPNSTIEYHYQYGTSSGVYTEQTPNMTATGGQPHEVVISGLLPNTKYYYRMRYHAPGDSMEDWITRAEHSFWTQRAQGSTFKFTIISDSHFGTSMCNNTLYTQTLQNANADNPDFHFDLGDTFMLDGLTSASAVNQKYLNHRPYMEIVGHSAPIFLASGNHENEEGWNLDDTPFSIALGSIQARKAYYPTPIPDGFYSGNTDTLAAIGGDGLREDYYAWTWGDALFVVIDPFQYTMTNPYGAMAGEGSDDPASGDRWNWTLGLQQFNWLKQTLENSDAKYKFVFAHHMVGGLENYVRGGAVPAHMFEWGGNNADGTTWAFDTKRPGWGDTPIHQLMVANGVSAFFHGHDHQYAYEVRDGIVYQCLPQPANTSGFNYYSESDPYTERVFPNYGYLRVTVSPSQATVEYVKSSAVAHSYTILPNQTTNNPPDAVDDIASTIEDTLVNIDVLDNDSDLDGDALSVTGVSDPPNGTAEIQPDDTINYTPDTGYIGADSFTYDISDGNGGSDTATVNVTVEATPEPGILGDVNGDELVNSTDALIILSCDVGIDTSQFCPMNCGDVNGDGLVNSTDALIILSYDADMVVPYPVGESGCPSSVTPCSGCSP